jgi:hypothetical protein
MVRTNHRSPSCWCAHDTNGSLQDLLKIYKLYFNVELNIFTSLLDIDFVQIHDAIRIDILKIRCDIYNTCI